MFRKTTIAALILCGTMAHASAFQSPQLPSAQLLSNPVTASIWKNHIKNTASAYKKSDYVLGKLKALEAEQKSRMLKSPLSKNMALSSNVTDDTSTAFFNPLIQQFSDATAYINQIRVSAQETTDIIAKMSSLAEEAGRNSHTSDELKNLDTVFQALKSEIDFLQYANIPTGGRKVGVGGLKVTIGDNADDSNSISIAIPAFTSEALGLTNLHVDNSQDALNALDQLRNADKIMDTVTTIAFSHRLDDAVVMLWTALARLESSMILMMQNENLAYSALDGDYTPQGQKFSLLFEEQKDLMRATQTYVSLSGPIMLGLGSIHIQMGDQNTPDTRLDIKLPITDVHLSGLDVMHLDTVVDTFKSLSFAMNYLHNMIYGA